MLCVSKDHGRFVCPKLICYGIPLPDKNVRSRQDLALQVEQPDYYENMFRESNETRVV